VALPAFARHTPLLQQLTDISCPLGLQRQTGSSGFADAGSCFDKQANGHCTVL